MSNNMILQILLINWIEVAITIMSYRSNKCNFLDHTILVLIPLILQFIGLQDKISLMELTNIFNLSRSFINLNRFIQSKFFHSSLKPVSSICLGKRKLEYLQSHDNHVEEREPRKLKEDEE